MDDILRFYILHSKRFAWGKLSNLIVALHVKFTPNKATEDTFREIVLEQLRYRQRLIEAKRWTLWLEMEQIAKKRGIQYDKRDDQS